MIKKAIACIILFVTVKSYSQELKNKFVINGNVSHSQFDYDLNVSNALYESQKNNNNLINISAGYFLTDNISVGLFGSFQKNLTNRTDNSFSYKSTTVYNSSGLFARYTKLMKESSFGFFFELETGYSWGKQANRSTDTTNMISHYDNRFTQIAVSLSPGLIYFINKKFSVETRLGSLSAYTGKLKYFDSPEIKNSGFDLNFSLTTISAGFSYYFGGKKTTE